MNFCIIIGQENCNTFDSQKNPKNIRLQNLTHSTRKYDQEGEQHLGRNNCMSTNGIDLDIGISIEGIRTKNRE